MIATLKKAMVEVARAEADDLHFLFFMPILMMSSPFHFLQMKGNSTEQGVSYQPCAERVPQYCSFGLSSPSTGSTSGVGAPSTQSL